MLSKKNKNAVLINELDNIAVACDDFQKDEKIHIKDKNIVLLDDIKMAHKIAINDIKNGEVILKYGVSIGSATQDIKLGELVHIHNMKSNYIAI